MRRRVRVARAGLRVWVMVLMYLTVRANWSTG